MNRHSTIAKNGLMIKLGTLTPTVIAERQVTKKTLCITEIVIDVYKDNDNNVFYEAHEWVSFKNKLWCSRGCLEDYPFINDWDAIQGLIGALTEVNDH